MYHQNQKNQNQKWDCGDIENHKIYLKSELDRSKELKYNAERTLEFLMEKFRYLFDVKKKMIREIEINSKKIKEMELIFNNKYYEQGRVQSNNGT